MSRKVKYLDENSNTNNENNENNDTQFEVKQQFNNNNNPAIVKIQNNKISKTFFSIGSAPPINASGTELAK